MYDHDITHCNNENCKNKDTCYRYLAHLEAKEKGYTYLTYLVIDDLVEDNCSIYWEVKKNG